MPKCFGERLCRVRLAAWVKALLVVLRKESCHLPSNVILRLCLARARGEMVDNERKASSSVFFAFELEADGLTVLRVDWQSRQVVSGAADAPRMAQSVVL